MADYLRTCIFRPYRTGMGPAFRLTIWETGRRPDGKTGLRYELRELGVESAVLFEGSDFGCSPMHGIDSDETMAALMGFLTLRPGDTDKEYFDKYTERQIEYCACHAEALEIEVERRFGEV